MPWARSRPSDCAAGSAPDDLARALNGMLPGDVRVLDAAASPRGLPRPPERALEALPLRARHRTRAASDAPALCRPRALAARPARGPAAAALYWARHDFASLPRRGARSRPPQRTLTPFGRPFDGATLVYEVEADGFLRKMVRSLVGGLVAAGRGAAHVEDLRRALEARDRGAGRRPPRPAASPWCAWTIQPRC